MNIATRARNKKKEKDDDITVETYYWNDSVLARVYYGSIQPAFHIKMSTGEGAMTLHCRSSFPPVTSCPFRES